MGCKEGPQGQAVGAGRDVQGERKREKGWGEREWEGRRPWVRPQGQTGAERRRKVLL